jgi:murein hydrolase activator
VQPNNCAIRRRTRIAALALTAIVSASTLGYAVTTEPGAELETLREQTVAAAQATQEQERKFAALAHRIELMRREAEGRQRGLDDSRAEQAALLGVIERLARKPPDAVALGPESPLDRARGRMLIAATLPQLRAEAHALAQEIERVAVLHTQIAKQAPELDAERDTLRQSRDRLAEIVARRLALSRKLVPQTGESDKRVAKLGREATDLTELIRQADAEADRRAKDLLVRASEKEPKEKAKSGAPESADPTRPRHLRAFDADHLFLLIPAAGTLVSSFGAEDSPGNTSQGLNLAAMPGAAVVAPFDGQIIYAGPFRGFGPSLILRHGGGYHSVLAGLGRLDVSNGQWILAGEPVGAMPDAVGDGSSSKLYIELRHDGRPVDPQPLLAKRDESMGPGQQFGEQRVRE